MVGPTQFVFAFIVFVCSTSVVVSEKSPPPCPNGTHPSWYHRCIYINDNQDDDEPWRMNQEIVRAKCAELDGKGSGYKWNLPSFQFNGKHETLLQILREHACDGDCSSDDFMGKMKKWHFWIRLIRAWETDGDEKPKDDGGEPMNETSKWTWGADRHKATLAKDLADGKCEFPPWAEREPNEAYRGRYTGEDKTCVISMIKKNGTYPGFEWVAAPCNLQTGEKVGNLREAMKTNGILMCEGIPPSQDDITSTSSSTPSVEATTPHVPSIVWHPAFIGILVSLVCMSAFFIGCSILYCFNRRRIRELESTAKKSKFVSTTSSDIPSMSTLVNLDSIGRRADDDDESERERSRRKGKKK